MPRATCAAPKASGRTAPGATSTRAPRSPPCSTAMGPAPRTKILVAVDPDNRDRLTRVLEGHELVFVETGNEARIQLERERFGLVCLGVHFDESQMFSLLGDIRAHAKYRKVPVLCVLGSWGRVLSVVVCDGLDTAEKALVAEGCYKIISYKYD